MSPTSPDAPNAGNGLLIYPGSDGLGSVMPSGHAPLKAPSQGFAGTGQAPVPGQDPFVDLARGGGPPDDPQAGSDYGSRLPLCGA